MEKLKALDRYLFTLINNNDSEFWDPIMVLVSERNFWFPAYFLLIVFLAYTFKRRAIAKLILVLMAVGSADLISSRFFKPGFARLRPCHDPSLSETINIVSGCGGQFGFISSHASTTFALATFMFLVLPAKYRWLTIGMLIWAATVSFSRIYLGVHYPGDVLAGALLGSLLAWIFAMIYRKVIKRYSYFGG